MKVKLIRDRKKNTSLLVVRAIKREKLEYAQAEFLCRGTEDCFLPFSYATDKDELVFTYDTTDLVQMDTYLKAKLSLSQFHALLAEVVRVVERCETHELHYANLLFDSDQVFLDPATNDLRFAYVPAKGSMDERADIIAFLQDMSSRVAFICEEDRAHAHELIDFLQRQTVFSLIDFSSFIDRNQLERRRDLDDNTLAQTETPATAKSVAPSSAKGFDFLKKQAGSVSAQEHRLNQNLVEQVFSDVSEIPSGPTTMPKASPAPQSFLLVHTSTGDKYKLLPDHTYSLGRSNRCDISIKGNSGISREHAHIQVSATGCFLTDQGSTNGCSVDGQSASSRVPTEVKRGATIKLADEEFSVE